MTTDYNPAAPDLSVIDNREDLSLLIEEMSARIHDAWSAERIRQGWKLGPQRDDAKKEHPGLIPYDELEEDDKVLDRITVRTSLAALIESGYDIAVR